MNPTPHDVPGKSHPTAAKNIGWLSTKFPGERLQASLSRRIT